jgi:hypothetical protein
MSGITSHRDPLISESDGMELGVNVQTWLKYKQRRGESEGGERDQHWGYT